MEVLCSCSLCTLYYNVFLPSLCISQTLLTLIYRQLVECSMKAWTCCIKQPLTNHSFVHFSPPVYLTMYWCRKENLTVDYARTLEEIKILSAHPVYVPLYAGTCGGWIVRVLNLFTGEARRTPLMPRKVVPEKHMYVNCFQWGTV